LSTPPLARPDPEAELKFVSLLRVALLNAIYEIPPSPPQPLGARFIANFPVCAAQDGLRRERIVNLAVPTLFL